MPPLREQSRTDRRIDLANYNNIIRGLRDILQIYFDPAYFITSGRNISFNTASVSAYPAFDAVIQAGRYRPSTSWASGGTAPTGAFPAQAAAATDYLFVPFDDSEAPYYTTQTAYEKSGTGSNAGALSTGAVDYAQSSDDVRKNGEFYKISETAGVQHLPRA